MFEQKTVMYLYVETPLHAGAGAGVGLVDLPIQRERITGYPMVNSGGVKGALRGVAEQRAGHDINEQYKLYAAFGPKTDSAQEHAGALIVGDARLLLFPVRSMRGIFAWTTSRNLLSRFVRDAMTAGVTVPWHVPAKPPKNAQNAMPALVARNNDVTTTDDLLVLEEFQFATQQNDNVAAIGQWLADNALPEGNAYAYWRERLPQALVILPEDDFRDFTQYATEVITRVQLDSESKTVKAGPWVEEHLPTDTLLYSPIYASRARFKLNDLKQEKEEVRNALEAIRDWTQKGGGSKVMQHVTQLLPECIQLGGNMTVGRGIVRLRFQQVEGEEQDGQ